MDLDNNPVGITFVDVKLNVVFRLSWPSGPAFPAWVSSLSSPALGSWWKIQEKGRKRTSEGSGRIKINERAAERKGAADDVRKFIFIFITTHSPLVLSGRGAFNTHTHPPTPPTHTHSQILLSLNPSELSERTAGLKECRMRSRKRRRSKRRRRRSWGGDGRSEETRENKRMNILVKAETRTSRSETSQQTWRWSWRREEEKKGGLKKRRD